MRKVIINADDCGRNIIVDQYIKYYIVKGLLTSTSVMANMEDFDGAVELYSSFSRKISFGAHLNLSEGCPLTNPSIFLKYGFCKLNNDKIVFDGMSFRWKYINSELRKAAYEELVAQVEKIRNAGIQISHIDSHQHIHFSPCLIPVFSQVAKDLGIFKIRRPKNFLRWNLHDIAMRGLNAYYNLHMRGLKMTDYFSSGIAYVNWSRKKDGVYELMCHPGHDNHKYQEEIVVLQEYFKENFQECLISYNKL